MKSLLRAFLILALGCPVTATFADEDDVAPAFDRWAAVAFSLHRMRTNMTPIGKAVSEDSQYAAGEVAKIACHEADCEVKAYVERGCIGVAEGAGERGGQWLFRYGFGSAKYARYSNETVFGAKQRASKAAGLAAKAGCEGEFTWLRCTRTEVYCTWDVDLVPSDARSIDNWVANLGGEMSQSIYNIKHLVGLVTQSYFLRMGLNYDKSHCITSRKWARVGQMARACRLSLGDLDILDANANK